MARTEKEIRRLAYLPRKWRTMTAVGVSTVAIACGIGRPALAELWKLSRADKAETKEVAPPAKPVPAENGFTATIRRLMAESRRCADKGDYAKAIQLAERAAKISEATEQLLGPTSECSPEVTKQFVAEIRARQAGFTHALEQLKAHSSEAKSDAEGTPTSSVEHRTTSASKSNVAATNRRSPAASAVPKAGVQKQKEPVAQTADTEAHSPSMPLFGPSNRPPKSTNVTAITKSATEPSVAQRETPVQSTSMPNLNVAKAEQKQATRFPGVPAVEQSPFDVAPETSIEAPRQSSTDPSTANAGLDPDIDPFELPVQKAPRRGVALTIPSSSESDEPSPVAAQEAALIDHAFDETEPADVGIAQSDPQQEKPKTTSASLNADVWSANLPLVSSPETKMEKRPDRFSRTESDRSAGWQEATDSSEKSNRPESASTESRDRENLETRNEAPSHKEVPKVTQSASEVPETPDQEDPFASWQASASANDRMDRPAKVFLADKSEAGPASPEPTARTAESQIEEHTPEIPTAQTSTLPRRSIPEPSVERSVDSIPGSAQAAVPAESASTIQESNRQPLRLRGKVVMAVAKSIDDAKPGEEDLSAKNWESPQTLAPSELPFLDAKEATPSNEVPIAAVIPTNDEAVEEEDDGPVQRFPIHRVLKMRDRLESAAALNPGGSLKKAQQQQPEQKPQPETEPVVQTSNETIEEKPPIQHQQPEVQMQPNRRIVLPARPAPSDRSKSSKSGWESAAPDADQGNRSIPSRAVLIPGSPVESSEETTARPAPAEEKPLPVTASRQPVGVKLRQRTAQPNSEIEKYAPAATASSVVPKAASKSSPQSAVGSSEALVWKSLEQDSPAQQRVTKFEAQPDRSTNSQSDFEVATRQDHDVSFNPDSSEPISQTGFETVETTAQANRSMNNATSSARSDNSPDAWQQEEKAEVKTLAPPPPPEDSDSDEHSHSRDSHRDTSVSASSAAPKSSFMLVDQIAYQLNLPVPTAVSLIFGAGISLLGFAAVALRAAIRSRDSA